MHSELVRVENLSFSYKKNSGLFRPKLNEPIFESVNFSIFEGEALGLFGASGCGKSTLVKCLLQLVKPEFGSIFFEGQNIFQSKKFQCRTLGKKMQIVFQDSASTLNPSWLVHFIMDEPLKIYSPSLSREKRNSRIFELLDWVGLDSSIAMRLPGELSGGQRQRVSIARALAVEPRLLVLDEPVSQLDMCIQSSILQLLIGIQEKQKISYLLISHDLKVLQMVCHRILKMERKKIFSV